MKPRERIGQLSIASEAPTGHSAPMPIPSKARKKNSTAKLGAKPARKLQTENQAMEIISGFLRPIRSASQPDAVAPTSRSHKVNVKTAVTAVSGTPNSRAIDAMMKTKIVKSKASSVHPNHAAVHACHCCRLGSRHQA